MNTQSIFETQSSKEEIVDIPNKPTLQYYFIKNFDKETTQKKSLNDIVSIIFPQKKKKNNEDLNIKRK